MVPQRRFPARYFAWFAILYFITCPLAKGQSTLTVNIRFPDGTRLDVNAEVNLYNFEGSLAGIPSFRNGAAEFFNLGVGRYTVEVIAPGYEKLREPIEILGHDSQIFLSLTPESSTNASTGPPGPPILAQNAQKELNKALEAIRGNKPEEARKHLEKASRAAPANPDVNFMWGAYYSQINDWTKAKSCWVKVLQIYPRHVSSLSALAQTALKEGDLPSAISYFSRAVEAEPSAWRYQERLADAYLRHKEFVQAQTHAERAIELGKDRASGARLILAQALVQQNNRERAVTTLKSFLDSQPSDPHAVEARRLLERLRQAENAASAVQPVVAPAPAATSASTLAEELAPPAKWMPPDIDESMPPVEPGVVCPLQEIADEAGKRIHDFIDAVNRITATEKLENDTLDRSGFPAGRETRSFSYVADIQEIRPGMLDVQEYRNGTMDPEIFPQHLATIGLPSLVIIFLPSYRDEFTFSCEGLSRWHGGSAWQVHFHQKPDKPARVREYRLGGRLHPIPLRGRAWIATDTFQVVSLETDIVSPMPEIQLAAEHISIDYAPVTFRKYNQKLWLPQSAELFFDFRGRRMHRRHEFSNYLLFAVDEKEKISDPIMKSEADPTASSPKKKP